MKKTKTPTAASGGIVINLGNSGGLLPSPDAAKRLNVKTSTLAAWRCAGIGPPFYKIGKGAYYSVDDLTTWLITRRREPTKKAQHVCQANAAPWRAAHGGKESS